MKHDLLKTFLWVASLITTVYMICEAFREGKLILVNANLASQKLEHEHQERMIDRLLEYNQQTASATGYFHTHPSE